MTVEREMPPSVLFCDEFLLTVKSPVRTAATTIKILDEQPSPV